MRQVLYEFSLFGHKIPLYGYGVMIVIALYTSTALAAWRARREKLDPETIYDLSFWVVIGGLLGARGFYVWQYWGTKIKTIAEAVRFWQGGIVFYGSVLGGFGAIFLYWYFRRFPLRATLDAIAPALALGIALGRIGCFLNGCCYGDVCEKPAFLAVRFPAFSPAWQEHLEDGRILAPRGPQPREKFDIKTENGRKIQVEASDRSLPVHPTQLYSAVDGFVLLALLTAFYPLRRRDGQVLALLMITYPITRFLIEYLRDDEAAFFAGLTISQTISLLIFSAGLITWVSLSFLPRGRVADRAIVAEDTALAAH